MWHESQEGLFFIIRRMSICCCWDKHPANQPQQVLVFFMIGMMMRKCWDICWDTPQRLPTTTGVAFFEDDGYMLRYTPGLPTTPSIGLVYDVMCMLRYTPGLLATTGLGLFMIRMMMCSYIWETHNGKHQSRRRWLPASCVSLPVTATRLVGDLDWFVNFILEVSNYNQICE